MNAANLAPLLELSPAELALRLAGIGDNAARQEWVDRVFDAVDSAPAADQEKVAQLAWRLNDIAIELNRGCHPESIRESRYCGVYSLDYSDEQLVGMARESTGYTWWLSRTSDIELIRALQCAYDTLARRGDDRHGYCRDAYSALVQAEEAALFEIEAARREQEVADMGKPDLAAAPEPDEAPDPSEHYATTVRLTSAADIRPEPIRWLWDGYLAQGKLVLIAGPAGVSKTTATMSLAATLSRAGRWPDGSRAPLGDVLIWSGEDDPSDTLVPRLLAAGADLERIRFITSTVEECGERRPFDPATDIPALRRAMASGEYKLLIVDLIVSAVSGDSHKNTEVRRNLQPLVDLAAATGVCVVGITHFTKGTQGRDPLDRVTGSVAFGALARVVIACSKDASDDAGAHDRLFVRTKSNIGEDGGGFRYAVEQVAVPGHVGLYASRCTWGDPLEGNARDILSKAESIADPEERNALADAMAFLRGLLADGPVETRVIRADADAAGHAWRTVQRAQKALGIEAVKSGMRGGWTWQLPPKSAKTAEECQEIQTRKCGALHDPWRSSGMDSGEVEL